jgi:hypothetical protein
MKSLLFWSISTALFLGLSGCAMFKETVVQKSDLTPDDGIVFGKIGAVFLNGVKAKDGLCTMNYTGGLSNKSVVLKNQQFFSFKMDSGKQQTGRFTCYTDPKFTSNFELQYTVKPNALNYLGNLVLHIEMNEQSTGKKIEMIFSPLPAKLEGGMGLEIFDYFTIEKEQYLKQNPEFKDIRIYDTTAEMVQK